MGRSIDTEKFLNILLNQKQRLTGMRGSITDTGLGTSLSASISELSTYDNHPADVGTETFERSKDLAIRGSLGQRVRDIDEAIQRLQAGRYGDCLMCGREIDYARLEAMPETKFCKECKERLEKEESIRRRVRPIEEEVLSPPFGRGWRDYGKRGSKGSVEYDGEDAWQEVARYGTSETPQDVPEAEDYEDMYVDADERRGGVEDLELMVDEEGEVIDEEGNVLE